MLRVLVRSTVLLEQELDRYPRLLAARVVVINRNLGQIALPNRRISLSECGGNTHQNDQYRQPSDSHRRLLSPKKIHDSRDVWRVTAPYLGFLSRRQVPPWQIIWQQSYSSWHCARQIGSPLQVELQKLRFWTHALPQLGGAAPALKSVERTSSVVRTASSDIRRTILFFLSQFEVFKCEEFVDEEVTGVMYPIANSNAWSINLFTAEKIKPVTDRDRFR